MTERQIAARRCAEIAAGVAEELGNYSNPAWGAATEIEERIKREFEIDEQEGDK